MIRESSSRYSFHRGTSLAAAKAAWKPRFVYQQVKYTAAQLSPGGKLPLLDKDQAERERRGWLMAKFNMVVPHGLPQGEALRRIQGEVENLKREYGDKVGNLRDFWNNDTYVFEGVTQGFAVSGVMMVKPSHIEIAANLPWLAIPFKGRIEKETRERFRNLLV